MKRIFFAFAAMSFLFAGCDSGNKYTVNGEIAGVTEGKVYLNELNSRDLVKVDSAEIVNGKFTFTGTVTSPDMRYITLEGKNAGIQFFIENAKIQIKGELENLKEAQVTGSASNDIFNAYGKLQEGSKDLYRELNDAYKKASEEKNQTAMDSIVKVWDDQEAKDLAANKEFVKANSNSVVAAYIGRRLTYQLTVEEMEEMYNTFAENVKASSYAKEIKEKVEILKKVAVGQPAPDFTLNTPEDEPFTMSSLKGKVVLIDFWASWCGPCRRENPHMVEIYKEFHDKGVEFLGVSLDKKKENWIKAIEADGLIWKHVSDLQYWSSEAAKLYGVNSIPHTVLIDQNGVIVGKKLFGDELKAEIEKLLN